MNFDEDVMAELADGTGGTFFHNSNDLEGGFKSLTQAPEYVYLLQFEPKKVKSDGAYHPLKVKVDRRDLKLQARRGYFAPKPDKASAAIAQTVPQSSAPPSPSAPESKSPSQLPPAQEAAQSAIAPETKVAERKPKSKVLLWDPPNVDGPVHSQNSSSPCTLSGVLEQAGSRAGDLAANLQNFTAQENIEFQLRSSVTHVLQDATGAFDYIVVFGKTPRGLTVQENRVPERGHRAFPFSIQDVGIPEMALIFLPEFQGDYEMRCDGAAEWNGQATWVVHFQQRKDRPTHTVSFEVKGVAHPAKLKGRAWIAQDSGEVVHLETSLMEAMPAANVRQMYLTVDYAPVPFRTLNTKVWLPQAADAYGDFGDHYTIAYHTFTDFLLFSVQTDQVIEKPKEH